MKAMEYTSWTLCDCGDTSDGPHYAEQGGVKHWWANNQAYFKRLTDAECAAEYWRAFTIFNAVASGGIAGDPIAANHQLDVWHRFATTPHAFEGGY